ncbi:hypothetical protein B8W98_04735 [Lentilactobacillus parakefiri]|uniref:Uncharacterized protein n=3 Tax=Lentilactobacillus parakefiri TaxID=152332 RepID=A0A269YGI4_9LACO|nr:hypothetical protein B8W98_04735 [Lentilactobacillus parakefiri]
MNKSVLLITLGLFGGGCIMTTNASAQTRGLHRISSHWVNQSAKEYNGLSQYYRFNQNTKSGPFKEAKVILPKGTIVKGSVGNDSASQTHYALRGPSNLSYALKKRVGMKDPWRSLNYWQTYMPSRYTRVKRPPFMPTFGEGVFFSGGTKAFKNMATRSKSTSNAFRISSDGYVEFYKYRAKSLIDNDYQVFTYNQKPASYAKINHTLVKGSKTYLYYGYNLKGINDKRARTSGAYKYRLTIHNLHTPYRYTTRGGTSYGSMYTIGSHHFYSIPLGYESSGSD